LAILNPAPPALEITRKVLRGLRVLNVVYGVGIAALLVVSFLATDFMVRALGSAHGPGMDMGVYITGVRLLMLVGIAGAGVAHVILTRLIEIVDTVEEGDPFVPLNAARIQQIAWWLLGGEGLHFLAGAAARYASSSGHTVDIDWSFSFTPWIAVLGLFVLARVFEHGTRMRADLEGTV
jgi:hypothetical protein